MIVHDVYGRSVYHYRMTWALFYLKQSRSTEDVMKAIEDDQVMLSTYKASRFVKPFIHDVDNWERDISLILEVTEALLTVQRQWLYLEVFPLSTHWIFPFVLLNFRLYCLFACLKEYICWWRYSKPIAKRDRWIWKLEQLMENNNDKSREGSECLQSDSHWRLDACLWQVAVCGNGT